MIHSIIQKLIELSVSLFLNAALFVLNFRKSAMIVCVLILCLFPVIALADVWINDTYFPDDNFKREVCALFTPVKLEGDTITTSELDSIVSINISNKGIRSLQGIEYFTNLRVLSCSNNPLVLLDTSANSELETLVCIGCQLTLLSISNNAKLRVLSCFENQLTSLDVSNNAALVRLNCRNNQLNFLDISKNHSLRELHCDNNSITSLDFCNHPTLEELYCEKNQLKSLDLNNCTMLWSVRSQDNQLTNIDIDNCTALFDLSCQRNQLTKLDVSGAPYLKRLECNDNNLVYLDLSTNHDLQDVNCADNQLKSLTVNNLPVLECLDCSNNKLKSLDIDGNTMLWGLRCANNELLSLDLFRNLSLRSNETTLSPQKRTINAAYLSGKWKVNIHDVDNHIDLNNTEMHSQSGLVYDKYNGLLTLTSPNMDVVYDYDVNSKSVGIDKMTVVLTVNGTVDPPAPQTGDGSTPYMWLGLMLLTSLICVYMLRHKSDIHKREV